MELVNGTTPDEIRNQIAVEDDRPVPLNEYDKLPDAELFEYFGVSSTKGNKVGFTDLYNAMKKVNLNSHRMKAVQDEWFKGFDAYTNVVTDPVEKAKRLETRERLQNRRIRLQEDSIANLASEAWDKNKHAMAGQAERLYDATVQRLDTSDEELLAKYDPKLLERVNALGGMHAIKTIGVGVTGAEDDLTGTLGVLAMGATEEQRALSAELMSKLDIYRSKETLSRANQEAVTIERDDGSKFKTSRMHGQQIIDQQDSSVVGQKELAEAFEKDALSVFAQDGIASGVKHLIFNQGLGSTVRQLPTTVVGTAMMFISPPAGLAIMNSGNMTDQEWQNVSANC